jgi:ribonuclease P protein component
MERWLSLTVSQEKWSAGRTKKPLFLISIPKKIVRQAVRRNRIKRVLREVLRNKPFFEKTKVYVFKVLRSPETVNLESARQIIDELFQ